MAFIKAWIHFVWTTKNRKPLLLKGIKEQLVEHIKENASAKNIYIDSLIYSLASSFGYLFAFIMTYWI